MLDAEKLKQLKDTGHITEEEYIDEKKRLAAQILKRQDSAHAKNGIVYILLDFFLGTIGMHNFYAGYWGRALVQLTLTIIAPWFLSIPFFIVWIWIFAELLSVNKDAHHIPFKGNRKVIWGLRIAAVVIVVVLLASLRLVTDEIDFSFIEQIDPTVVNEIIEQ